MNFLRGDKLITNNPVLYGTTIISFLNILGYIQKGKINLVLLYIIIALVLKMRTKNMVIILGVPLIIVNLVSYMGYNIEGMKDGDNEEEEYEEEYEEDENDEYEEEE